MEYFVKRKSFLYKGRHFVATKKSRPINYPLNSFIKKYISFLSVYHNMDLTRIHIELEA